MRPVGCQSPFAKCKHEWMMSNSEVRVFFLWLPDPMISYVVRFLGPFITWCHCCYTPSSSRVQELSMIICKSPPCTPDLISWLAKATLSCPISTRQLWNGADVGVHSGGCGLCFQNFSPPPENFHLHPALLHPLHPTSTIFGRKYWFFYL